jgi:hypothetical protein
LGGGHASQAFARNLTWDGERVGFIDLEEDPATVMPPVAAQARDLLLYVQSSARVFEREEAAFREALAEALAEEPAAVRAEAVRTARALGGLVRIALRLGGMPAARCSACTGWRGPDAGIRPGTDAFRMPHVSCAPWFGTGVE